MVRRAYAYGGIWLDGWLCCRSVLILVISFQRVSLFPCLVPQHQVFLYPNRAVESVLEKRGSVV